MLLKVGVYAEYGAGQWQKASGANGQQIPDTFITMRNGQASFALPGNAKYKVTIDSGSSYSFSSNVGEGIVSPQFYLEVEYPRNAPAAISLLQEEAP